MKLAGVKLIELSLFLPGPHLTMRMADHGADVVGIEPSRAADGGRWERVVRTRGIKAE